MKRHFLVLFLFTFVLSYLDFVTGDTSKIVPKDYSGIYEVQGVETNGPYCGIAIIKKLADRDDQYVAQWTSVIGQNAVGNGYVRDGYLIFSWSAGPNVRGITEYTLGKNGKHKGRWHHTSNYDWQDETIEFKMALPEVKIERPKAKES